MRRLRHSDRGIRGNAEPLGSGAYPEHRPYRTHISVISVGSKGNYLAVVPVLLLAEPYGRRKHKVWGQVAVARLRDVSAVLPIKYKVGDEKTARRAAIRCHGDTLGGVLRILAQAQPGVVPDNLKVSQGIAQRVRVTPTSIEHVS